MTTVETLVACVYASMNLDEHGPFDIRREIAIFDPVRSYPCDLKNGFMSNYKRSRELNRINSLIEAILQNKCDDPFVWLRVIEYAIVIVDAVKHKLDYKRAYDDFRIADLYSLYDIS